jgi:hypothetical protein
MVSNISHELQVAYYLDAVQREDAIEYSNELAEELLHALEQFANDQSTVEESWLAFWGVGNNKIECGGWI